MVIQMVKKKTTSSYKRKNENVNFKELAKKVNAILKRDFKINLNFAGYEQTIKDIERIDETDFVNIKELIFDSNNWADYLKEMQNLLEYFKDLYKNKYEILEYLHELNQFDLVHCLSSEDCLLTNDFKRRFKIRGKDPSSIDTEIAKKLEQAKDEYKSLKKFTEVLGAKSKYFEGTFYSLINMYKKSVNDLFFK